MDQPVIPATAPETPAAPAPATEPSLSEFEQHKVSRGFMETPKRPEAPAVDPPSEPEPKPAAETTVNPLAAAPEPPEPPPTADDADPPAAKGPEPVDKRWKDPDTGVVLDLRYRKDRRIKHVLEERAQLAQRLAAIEARIAQGGPQRQPPPQAQAQRPVGPDPNDPEPTLEQFSDKPDPYAAWMDAKVQHGVRQALKQHGTQQQQAFRQQQMRQQVDTAQSQWDAKLPEVRQKYHDFDAAYGEFFSSVAGLGRRGRPLVAHLLKSPVGHDVAYFLGNHPEELERLFAAPSLDAHYRAIGALEARIEQALKAQPAPTSTTRAAAPITPVNAGAPAARRNAEDVAKEGDYQAYRALRGMPSTAATASR